MKAESQSASPLLIGLLFGVPRKGVVLNPRNLLFGDYVVSLTPPDQPHMPNGIECRAVAAPSARVVAGRGSLIVGRVVILPGRSWDPVPAFDHIVSLPAGPEPLASALSAWAPESGAAGHALMAGYVAGLVLLHGQRKRAAQIAARASRDSDPVSATALRHAAAGEVPQQVHALLADGDAGPLLGAGASGVLWLRGLISAGLPFEPATGLLSPALRTPALPRR